MSTTLITLATGLSINFLSSLISEQKLKLNEKDTIKGIQIRISDFNRKYDNTELDTFTFQKYFETSNVENRLFNRIFTLSTDEVANIELFKIEVAKDAIDYVNQQYQLRGRSNIKDEEIFYEYFNGLIDELIGIRANLLPFKDIAQTAIIVDEIRDGKKEIVERIEELRKIHNPFADDKINEVKELISVYKFEEALNELNEALEAQNTLSNSQIEELYYQRARIYINTNNYKELETVKNKIENINKNSKFINEINFYIACHEKNRHLFTQVYERLKELKYSQNKLQTKEAHFYLVNGQVEIVKDVLLKGNELKNDLEEDHEAQYLYGFLLMNQGDFDLAKKSFEKAYSIQKNIRYKYNALLMEHNVIMEKEMILDYTNNQKMKIENLIHQFRNIRYITKFFSVEELISYWECLLNLISLVDKKELLNEIENIEQSIINDTSIKSLIAGTYFFNGMENKAKEILEDIWKGNLDNTIKLFIILEKEEAWQSILNNYQQLPSQEFSEHPIIIAIHQQAKYKVFGYDAIKEENMLLLERESSVPVFLYNCLISALENSDEESIDKTLFIIKSKKYSEENIIFLSEPLLKYKRYDEVRQIIEGESLENERLFDLYIQTFDELNVHSELTREVYDKVKSLYDSGNRFENLLKFKVNLEVTLGISRKVIKTLEEYKNIFGIDEFYAKNLIVFKLEKRSFHGSEEEIKYLLNSSNIEHLQLVAAYKAGQGLWEEAKTLSMRALYLSHDHLKKEILYNYVIFNFSNLDQEENEAELSTVKVNSVVTISNSKKTRIIAIHQQKDLIKKPGEYKFNCENYSSDDPIGLILLSDGEKGELIQLFDGEYKIDNIVNLPVYFNQFALGKLEKDYPEHGFYDVLSAVSPEVLFEQLKASLAIINKQTNQQIDNYNFGIETGVPISHLSGKNIDSYAEMIISLLNFPKQHLYAGEVSVFNSKKYVLSLSSIIMLANLNILEKTLNIKEQFVISEATLGSIERGVKESQKHVKVSVGNVVLGENGKISSYSYTDEDKKNRKKYWTKILIAIKQIEVMSDEIGDCYIYDLLEQHLLDGDIEDIEISRKTNRVLVSDDLFIRKIHHSLTNINNTTNIVGLLFSENLLTMEELLELINKLAKTKYLYPLNSEILLELYHWVISIKETDKRKSNFVKLKEVYKNILDEDSSPHYNIIHKEFVDLAVQNRLPSIGIYKLVEEPLKLMPFNQFIEEKKHEIFNNVYNLE